MVSSTAAVAGRKPRVIVDRVRKASRRSRSTAEANPHHAGDAYDNLEMTVASKIVCRASVAGHGVEECAVQTTIVHMIQEDI